MSSRFEADQFFNAFQVLRRNDEAYVAHNSKSTQIFSNPFKSVPVPTIGVGIVCLAFSIELYIKDLYSALGKTTPKGRDGHNILKLYEGLPEQTRKAIFCHRSIIENPFATSHPFLAPRISHGFSYEGFLHNLKAISKGFEHWRYSYEHTSLHYDCGFATALIEAIASVTDSTRLKQGI